MNVEKRDVVGKDDAVQIGERFRNRAIPTSFNHSVSPLLIATTFSQEDLVKDVIKKIRDLIKSMKHIEAGGFLDELKAKDYFEKKELILEEMGKGLSQMEEEHSQEIEALKGTVKALRDTVKASSDEARILIKDEFHYNLGNMIGGL